MRGSGRCSTNEAGRMAMNEPGRSPDEEVSAFVDGELRAPVRDRIVGRLYEDPELRRAWARFHLIGDALRGIGPVPGAGSVAGKVGEALRGERVVPFEPRARRAVFGPLAGPALAASVAALAILGVRNLDDGSGPQPPAAGAARYESVAGSVPAAAAPAAAHTMTASAQPSRPASPRRSAVEYESVAGSVPAAADPTAAHTVTASAQPSRPASPRRSAVEPDAEARLNTYLVSHNEYAGNGVLPYVRIVGYQSAAGGHR